MLADVLSLVGPIYFLLELVALSAGQGIQAAAKYRSDCLCLGTGR